MGVKDLKYSDESEEQIYPIEPIDENIFTEIEELYEKIRKCQTEQKENRKKSEKLSLNIKVAEELIIKAEEKKAALMKKAENLKASLQNMTLRTDQSLEYWKNYGLDVRQVSTESDPFEQYEFIFTKLSKYKHQGATSEEDDGPEYTITILFSDRRLNVVSQEPEVMKPEQLEELNTRLNNNCVNFTNDTTVVDYKSAMVMIKKDLVKSITLLSKTC